MNDLTLCPAAIRSNAINVQNHLKAIEEANLGPADPLERNDAFWKDKAVLWGITAGDARGRLCNNCEYYYDTPAIRECISTNPANDIKASQLPLVPPWADIEDHPVGYCEKWDITCSPVRTCDDQEIYQREDSPEDVNPILDYVDPFKSPLED